jgi:hypothetical protein
MAAIKYLSEFYTTKAVLPVNQGPRVASPSTPLEEQIQIHVLRGNDFYFKEKYTSALGEYLAAWGLIPKLIDKFFPFEVAMISPSAILALDLTKGLLSASAEIHALRSVAGPLAPLGGGDPPPELMALSKKFGATPTAAERHYDRGLTLTRAGQFKTAGEEFEAAARNAEQNQRLQIEARSAVAMVTAAMGNFGAAQEQFTALSRDAAHAGLVDHSAAMLHNSGVAQTLNGDAAGAAQAFAKSTSANPGALNWSTTHSVNPGIAAFDRPTGIQGMQMVLGDGEGSWLTLPSKTVAAPKSSVAVLKDRAGIQLDLTANFENAIHTQLLQPRIAATTIAALDTYYWSLPQFVTYLTHVSGFILPLALGDTYAQLGDYATAIPYYLKVRDYPFLNTAIERPMVWVKLARTYVQLGTRFYRDRNMAAARAQYENVVQIAGGGFVLNSPLYAGGFVPVAPQIMALLNAPDKLAFTALDFATRTVVLEALSNLNQILRNINYLGFPEDIVPIHSWRYLQNVARYLANQAIQMERGYINFKSTAEQEEATRLSLEQSVDAVDAAAEVEAQRVQAANDQLAVAQLSAKAAQTRLDNANARKADFAATSKQLALLDEITAWATGPMDEAEVGDAYAKALGITPGDYDTYHVTAYASRARSKVSGEYELRNMDRQITEAQDSLNIANAQTVATQSMVDVAVAQKQLADLRAQQAAAQLEHFNAEEFTPELWNALAHTQRELSQRYLDHAISAAFLMERAFEFEYDLDVNRIRFDYSRSDLHGLLAGDFLLADIDEFTFDRLLDTQKKVPVKVVIPLADRFPFQFFQQFQKTGRMEFDTLLEDFDLMHPGAHIQKLRRAEVVVEGLLPREGAQGVLSNSGFSYFRGRDGVRRLRQQKPESALLSLYDIRRDGFVFTTEEGFLQIFENSGPATGWTIEFPIDSNNFDYASISNINLVLYIDTFYSDAVRSVARAELEAGAVFRETLGLALRFQYPDEFFSLQDDGKVVFEIGSNYLVPNQINPRILDATIAVVTGDGVSHAGLVVNVQATSAAVNVNQVTDANGFIATGNAAEPLNALRDRPLTDTFTVAFDQVANAAAFAAGFTWAKVQNIFLNLEYEFEPRGRAAVTDDFSANSIADYDVVDDPGAAGGPSAWAQSAALGGSMQQTSTILGGALDTTPAKPGTYLVHKTSAQWPNLADVSIRCSLQSGDNHAIGLVFRYQDVNNFYFFLMDSQRNYRRIGKKVGGVFHELEVLAVQNIAPGFNLNQTYHVAVSMVGDAIAAFLDGVQVLAGRDSSIAGAGRVGLYAWGNPSGSFLDLSVRRA